MLEKDLSQCTYLIIQWLIILLTILYTSFNRITLLLNHANISTEEFRFGDIDEKFEFLVEANDDMLERIVRLNSISF